MKHIVLILLIFLALGFKAHANTNSYYDTQFEIDAVVGNEAIDFSERQDATIVVWNSVFNLSGYKRCIRSNQYSIDGTIAMSLTCPRIEKDHVSMTITAACEPRSISEDAEQMELTGDDMANHVLFTVKCRTKLIQEKHKS